MVSIIIPIFKVEKYLPKCIESILNQSYHHIELILVDDGSPDKCGEICDKYANSDSRIKVIHQQNRGVSAARNAGLEIASGDYIGFCDPDDFITPDMYGRMIETMGHYQTDMVICGYDYYDENYQKDESRSYPIKDEEVLTREMAYSKLSDMPPTIRHGVVNKLFRKKLLDGLNFDTTLHSAEDGYFLLDYLTRVQSAVFVHRPLYRNLIRNGSATHGGLHIRSLKDSFKVHERMYSDTVRLFPLQRQHAQAFLLDVCTLKYNEAKSRVNSSDEDVYELLNDMRKFIRRNALTCLPNKEIRWKTKIYYLLLWIRK